MRLDSPKTKRMIGWIGAFALPVALVQIAGWMSGSPGPAQARATDVTQQQEAATVAEDALRKIAIEASARTRISPQEQAAAERILALRRQPFGATPMLHAAPSAELPPKQTVEVVETKPETPVLDEPIPSFHLQAVISGSSAAAARAFINGRLCALGEKVPETDWTLAAINAEQRRVVLEHAPTGRAVVLTLKLPE